MLGVVPPRTLGPSADSAAVLLSTLSASAGLRHPPRRQKHNPRYIYIKKGHDTELKYAFEPRGQRLARTRHFLPFCRVPPKIEGYPPFFTTQQSMVYACSENGGSTPMPLLSGSVGWSKKKGGYMPILGGTLQIEGIWGPPGAEPPDAGSRSLSARAGRHFRHFRRFRARSTDLKPCRHPEVGLRL